MGKIETNKPIPKLPPQNYGAKSIDKVANFQSNAMVIKSLLSNESIAQYLADKVYIIFRYNLTKKEFKKELKKWLDADSNEGVQDAKL